MSVYKEGFYAINEIEKASKRIYNDSADFGALCKKGDNIWNLAKQLVDWYKVENTRQVGSWGVCCDVELMDEWAVSDGRKTEKEATVRYRVTYAKVKQFKGFTGFISVDKIYN